MTNQLASTLNISAMALNILSDDHVNKMPFNGVLVHLDRLSDAAPAGSYGKRIIVTADAGRRALPSLLGMAVNFTPSFDGHDTKNKIGIITSANIVGNAIVIAGFVYAADFPDTARTIKASAADLGFSFEAQRLTVLDPSAHVLTITELAFTGAAIIRKDKAAYTTTSLAASAARAPNKEIKMSFVTQTEFPVTAPLKPFPWNFSDKRSLIRTLECIGCTVPPAVTALAAAGQPLGAGGHKITIYELDQLLAQYDIPVRKRLQLKCELGRQGLL
jgi:hypothetical protein